MIFRKSSGSPTDISCAREGALDKATYAASHRSSCEKKRGNFQWKMRPGFARRHKGFDRILRGVVFSRFRINGRMVARRCCLSYGWPTGPTKNARCEDSGQKKRRDSSLLSLSAVYLEEVAMFHFSTELKPSRHLIEPDLNFEGLMERFCDHLLSFRRTLPVL